VFQLCLAKKNFKIRLPNKKISFLETGFLGGDDVNIDIKAVSTIYLMPILAEAIKEQQIMIEEMSKEIEILKQK
jgi:hypothetical protein